MMMDFSIGKGADFPGVRHGQTTTDVPKDERLQ
jgi:hypothetical protein